MGKNSVNATKTVSSPKSVGANSNVSDEDRAAKQFRKVRKSSYEAPRSCELIEDVSANIKRVRLFQAYDEFFSAKAVSNNKGFAIDAMRSNEFGDALAALGVVCDWKVTQCAGKKLGVKMFAMLKNQVSAASRKEPV